MVCKRGPSAIDKELHMRLPPKGTKLNINDLGMVISRARPFMCILTSGEEPIFLGKNQQDEKDGRG